MEDQEMPRDRSSATLLLSVSILRTRRLLRSAGVFGLLVATAALAGYASGRLGLDVRGFGLLTFAQSAWFVWVGVGLWMDDRTVSR
jgi:hypothetical protein